MTRTDLAPRTLPGTDITIGRIVLGCMTFGTQLDEAGSEQVVHRAREAGVTMFDTANTYSDGRSEQTLGRIVKPFRDEIQIATKVGSRRTSVEPGQPLLDRASIRRHCEESLKRLGTDRIDLYYLHMPDWLTPIEETLAACQELVASGKVLHIAASNYASWQLADAIRLAEANGWPPLRVTQPMYNLLARRLEEEYFSFTKRFSVSNLAYNPLAGGLLTGKHSLDQTPPPGTRFALRANYRERYWNQAQFDAVDHLSSIASKAGMSLIELALRWLLSREHVDGIILGVSSLEHLEANLAAASGPVPDAEVLDAIDHVWADLKGPAPSYNR